ncbi:MAG: hypothetical protein GY847_14970 [Proteobacteria bacterium]|nr:hypothetical protein [Pseudomonadota bacterium]
MDERRHINLKKNLLYFPEPDQARLIEGGQVFTWKEKMPWYCTARTRLTATVRPGMMLSYSPTGEYQVGYIQDVDPLLQRMRWTLRFTAFGVGNNQLLDFLVDTRELTMHPVTKSWVYQIHTGTEVTIARYFDEIVTWERDLSGNGWFKE